MNFAEAAQQVGEPLNNKYCKVRGWVETLEEDDRATIISYMQLLKDGTATVSGTWLYRVCKTMGLDSAQSRFFFHLSGECKCPK